MKEFEYCKEKLGGHRLRNIIYHLEYSDDIWPKNAVGYCTKCMAIYSQRIQDNISYGIWFNSESFEILEVNVTPLRYDEEQERYRMVE